MIPVPGTSPGIGQNRRRATLGGIPTRMAIFGSTARRRRRRRGGVPSLVQLPRFQTLPRGVRPTR